jgi:hypothetical protein
MGEASGCLLGIDVACLQDILDAFRRYDNSIQNDRRLALLGKTRSGRPDQRPEASRAYQKTFNPHKKTRIDSIDPGFPFFIR